MVFISCGHSSQGRWDLQNLNRSAAAFAGMLLEAGVKALVIAGWAVDDAAGATFTRTLYQELRSGLPLAEALRTARETTFVRHKEVTTWGAFHCYCDPEFALFAHTHEGGPSLLGSK
jgi:CHAT domain-containing protein